MTAIASGAPARARPMTFYSWMAIACLLAAFGGFIPTYWAPLAAGKFQANPVVHIHGLVFFAWTIFFLAQTLLVQGGNVRAHRAVGMAGVSLATVMTMLGLLAAINSLQTAVAFKAAAAGEAFSILPVTSILVFAGLFAWAVARVNDKETHKRLMLVATINLLPAPLVRPLFLVFTSLPPGPPPVWLGFLGGLIADLFLVAAVVYDWRTRGKPHPAYLIGGGIVLLEHLLWMPVSDTAAWHGVARGLLALGGHPAVGPG